MNKAIRFTTALVALGAAVASQAVTIDYVGKGALNGTTTSTLGDFGTLSGFTGSVTAPTSTAPTTITLDNGTGTLVFTLSADESPSATRYSGSATITSSTGSLSQYTGGTFSVVTNNLTSYVVSIQGDVQAVPEPASFAALGVGAVALMRRRKKA